MRLYLFAFQCIFILVIVLFNFISGNEKDVPDVTVESIKSISPKKVQIKWRPSFVPSSRSLDYIIRYKAKGEVFHKTASKKTETTLKNLSPNTQYVVMVRAVCDKERGDWSETQQITTRSRSSQSGTVKGTITIEDVSENSVLLEWTTDRNVSLIDDFSGFQIILKNKEGQKKKKTNDYTIHFDELKPENSYAANLYIVYNSGKRTRIGRTKFQTLEEQRSPPRKLRVKYANHRTIAVKWKHIKSSAANESLTGYVLQYRQRRLEHADVCEIFLDSETKSYKLNGLLPNIKYSIRIAGLYGNVTGSFTEWLRVKTTEFSPGDSDIRVFHVSSYSVMLKWMKEAHNITSASLDLVSNLSDDYTGSGMTNVKEMHLQLYTDAEQEVLKDLLPVTKYRATLTFDTHGQCSTFKYVEFETKLDQCESICEYADNETLSTYESYLRIIPLFDTEWLVTWQRLPPWIHDPDEYVFLLRLLGEPFMYELASYMVPGNQHYHIFEEFEAQHAYTLNIQLFKSNGGQSIISQYLLVLAMKDVINDRRSETVRLDFSNYWQPTSLDILIEHEAENSTLVTNFSDFASHQNIQGTNLVLISKSDVIDEWTNHTEDITKRDTLPLVGPISNVTVVEGMTLDVTCHARGDPYPTITWLNISTDETLGNGDTNMTQTTVDTKYVGSSVLVDGRAYMGVRSFLSIRNISLWSTNQYACAAESEAGSNISTFWILVIPRPPVPVWYLIITRNTPFEIEISWKHSDLKPENHPGHVLGYHVELLDEFEFVLKSINTTETQFVIDKMLPDTWYSVKVTAFHRYTFSEPQMEMFKMPAIPKLDEPEEITVTTLNATTMQVAWLPPRVVRERNVLLRGYVFRYKEYGTFVEQEIDVPKMFNNVTIFDLKPERKYEVRVIALSEDGQVKSSDWYHGNTSRESYMNETVPPPPPNAVFLKLLSGNIVVHWLPPNPDDNILVRGYTIEVFHNNTKRQAMEVGYKESNVRIYEVEMGILYRISVRAKNRAGISIDTSEELKIPIEYVTQFPVQNFKGTALSSTKLELTWEAPEKGAFSTFVLAYTLAGDRKPELPGGGNLPADIRNYVVRSLKPDTGYVFSITPYLKQIRGVTVNTTLKTYTDKPSNPPENVSLTVVNSTAILIKCSPPEKGKNGPILEYKIAYRDKRDRKYTVTEADDSEDLNYYLTGLEPATVYEIRVRAFTVNGSGPWSPWLQEKTGKREPVQPRVPRNLTTSTTETTVILYWFPPEQDIRELTGYLLGIGRFIPEVTRESVTRDQITFTFNNLDRETAYIVSIRSFNDFGESSAIFDLVTTL